MVEAQEEKILELTDIKTIDDIELVISQRAGVGLRDGDVPVGKKFAWFGQSKFELFQPVGISDHPLVIFAMFQDVNEVRVYAVLAVKTGHAPPKDCAPYQRFTLSKLAAGLVYTEVFPDAVGEPLLGLDTFINAIVGELQKLSTPDAGLEAQDRLDRALEALEAEDLDAVMKILKGEEEDEEETPKPNGQTAPAPAP